jgi:beta-glucosidase
VSSLVMKRIALAGVAALAMMTAAQAQAPAGPSSAIAALPWMDKSLSPDRRAELALAALTLDEKIQLVHGTGLFPMPAGSNGGAGFVPGVPRLGLPDLNMADSTVGVTRGAARSRYSTLMPAAIGEAASWDPQIAYDYGALIGRELRDQGYNVSLAGGVNIMREPRNGRSFEYRSEDPILTGKLAAQGIRGLQDQKVIGDIKHYAANAQETGRYVANVRLDERSLRESDLLAFEIGIKEGDPGMVMCSYNRVNGDWTCENDYLLNTVLKGEWGFKGFVLSDWGATHSTEKAALAGLDQEQPGEGYFGAGLKEAVLAGKVPQARLDDMVRRILRTEFAFGIVDHPPVQKVVDVNGGLEVAQRVAEAGSVLLKNTGVLPLKPTTPTIVVIGSHADVGILTGGGSGQVDPPGGSAVATDVRIEDQGPAGMFRRGPVWYPSAPLKAIRAKAPNARVTYDPGTDPAAAARAAKDADVVIVVANQPARESSDHKDLSLPDNQDALIAAVAAANPRTVVLLQTGGPVTMPWLDQVSAVVEVWYPGARGAEAIANLLFGDVNFVGKLPVTFPRTEADLPLPVLPGSTLTPIPAAPMPGMNPVAAYTGQRRMTLPLFDIDYPEKANVGYKWYDATGKTPLFAFGHGLSYTTYAYSDLVVTDKQATFTVKNTGAKAGEEIAQVYASVPARGEPPKRLIGWTKVALQPGEAKSVTVKIDPLHISVFDPAGDRWTSPRGAYQVFVGGSSRDTPLVGRFALPAKR